MLVPKFKVGQKVFAVQGQSDYKRVHESCLVCNSTGVVKIVGANGVFTCPKCHGMVRYEAVGFIYKIVHRNATIGMVKTEEYAKKYRRYRSGVKYMLDETGVGSNGALWPECKLFATEQEAQEFCDKYIPDPENKMRPVLKDSKNTNE